MMRSGPFSGGSPSAMDFATFERLSSLPPHACSNGTPAPNSTPN